MQQQRPLQKFVCVPISGGPGRIQSRSLEVQGKSCPENYSVENTKKWSQCHAGRNVRPVMALVVEETLNSFSAPRLWRKDMLVCVGTGREGM